MKLVLFNSDTAFNPDKIVFVAGAGKSNGLDVVNVFFEGKEEYDKRTYSGVTVEQFVDLINKRGK